VCEWDWNHTRPGNKRSTTNSTDSPRQQSRDTPISCRTANRPRLTTTLGLWLLTISYLCFIECSGVRAVWCKDIIAPGYNIFGLVCLSFLIGRLKTRARIRNMIPPLPSMSPLAFNNSVKLGLDSSVKNRG
jgi:hypothetical protein